MSDGVAEVGAAEAAEHSLEIALNTPEARGFGGCKVTLTVPARWRPECADLEVRIIRPLCVHAPRH